eukprot:1853734-Prymnesium_polylepis.1
MAVAQLVNIPGFTQSDFDPCYFFNGSPIYVHVCPPAPRPSQSGVVRSCTAPPKRAVRLGRGGPNRFQTELQVASAPSTSSELK